jgi:hypothetical protein
MVAAFFATALNASPRRNEEIKYGCNDLVVVGRLGEQDYQHVDIEDDILGHGWVTADVKINDILFGTAKSGRLPVRYFAHTYMREDRDFVLVLRPAEHGRYLVRSARLLKAGTELADRRSKPQSKSDAS